MRKSIATVSLSGMLPEKLEAAAAARFDGVEIFENDLLQFPGTPADVRRMCTDLGLRIDMFQPFRDFDGVSPEQLLRNLDRAERKFDVMEQLGTDLILVCANIAADASSDLALRAEQMALLAERAARRKFRIAFEALAWGGAVKTFRQVWDIVQRANQPNLGVALDSFHTLALRDDWHPIKDIPGQRIFYMQLADAPWVNTDPLTHSRHYRCFPGQGEMEVTGFVGAVLDSGYNGPMSLEIFSDECRAAPARATAFDAMRSLLWLEEQVRRLPSLKRPELTHGALGRAVLLDPPPPPVLHGWAFVEFAVDGPTAARLRDFLAVLGFHLIGRHRSKNVELLGQGDVRIVLNLEEDSFARGYFDQHGSSVCALALATNDAVAALARAEALGAIRVEGQVGPNELTIPAVRAPDGSLMYFFDTQHGGSHGFEADFVIEDRSAPSGCLGAQARIDYIAAVLPAGQLDSWVLFYRALLGLEPTPNTVLHDPYGIIRSRALEAPNKTVRYALNASERSGTAVGRAVGQFGGAGIHHIAIAVEDVVAAVRKMRACGMTMLAIPANYYDDLGAKYGVDEATLDEWRALGVMMERSGEGEILHAHTAPFDKRFLFEIIERRGGYDAYGAGNAPFHLAALAHWASGQGKTNP
ncbi:MULTISPECIES: bifunctional sugar phosphate isomerase/epimerase/4-hydroxyphenylpyruvate dioxygenase family protein [unclassified Massilia]|uniref:bifunctional sugar phosphate isomerase/epimerase/4-hydroxyphenylpyruvate dioxygenase family protein n=1 Tax=unclassified Massilia TaxID=2609279 RepID=UPI00177EDECE|nr:MULTISPECIES: sugar phosphate isomerase/epimerase and 4-hydroxyphenylpyruvate domain-containing protein [unclassified Massilia]MBD8532915.1 sugar phosphate isomerase/epimerase and 4-hydroxyphenylpyruvate domain-containing protein [Massilia sp. CFBP 13647]MBD8676321.1 sugar phosphate isomerase/epimerase and 4-hydroxyphenylpyruvate domain-containing protein [Massilia sp. CFBP 13721]